MIGWELPPHNSGGLGVACYGLTEAMARRAIDITFVLPQRMEVSADFMRVVYADTASPAAPGAGSGGIISPYADGGRVVAPPAHGTGAGTRVQRTESYTRPLTLYEQVQDYAEKVSNMCHGESFDVIHAHDWLSFPAGVRAREETGKPLVVHVHATEFDRTGGNSMNRQVYDTERWGMERADRVIAVSNFTRETIVSQYGIPREQVEVIHNGINPDEYATESEINTVLRLREMGSRIVLFIGRLTVQKGPDYFIEAASRVLEREKNVIFVIAGSGDMEGQLLEEAAARGIADHVFFTGFLRGEDWKTMYRSADVFVLPSVSEPFGIAPLEAMMHGVPSIVSRQSGVSEVLRNALKVDFWDVDEMAHKVLSILRHKSLHKELRVHGKREAKNLDWNAAAEKCIRLYSAITAE